VVAIGDLFEVFKIPRSGAINSSGAEGRMLTVATQVATVRHPDVHFVEGIPYGVSALRPSGWSARPRGLLSCTWTFRISCPDR
jgi:hypothetical protein